MIERLLTAERAVGEGDLTLAERLFRQVADADPRNAIAIVGLARVAAARGDRDGARRLVDRALEIDPDEAVARRLRDELAAAHEVVGAAPGSVATPTPGSAPALEPAPAPALQPPASELAREPAATPTHRSGLIAWLRRLLRLDR